MAVSNHVPRETRRAESHHQGTPVVAERHEKQRESRPEKAAQLAEAEAHAQTARRLGFRGQDRRECRFVGGRHGEEKTRL